MAERAQTSSNPSKLSQTSVKSEAAQVAGGAYVTAIGLAIAAGAANPFASSRIRLVRGLVRVLYASGPAVFIDGCIPAVRANMWPDSLPENYLDTLRSRPDYRLFRGVLRSVLRGIDSVGSSADNQQTAGADVGQINLPQQKLVLSENKVSAETTRQALLARQAVQSHGQRFENYELMRYR